MNFITKEELNKKDLISKFTIVNGILKLDDVCQYKNDFEIGDIVAYKNDTTKFGVITLVEEDELNIIWNDSSESTQTDDNLVIIPPTIGLELLKDTSILNIWEELSNGKSESLDLRYIYLSNNAINEVPFIKAFKNTTTIVDTKFKRNFYLYRKFSNTQIFRTNLYTICNDKIGLDSSRYVYYLLENNIVYYLGIDLESNDLNVYLFNR